MKTGEKFYFVSTKNNGLKKGDVIERSTTSEFELLEEESEFTLFGMRFTPAKRHLYDDPNVVLLEVSYDIRETRSAGIDLEEIVIFRVISTMMHYENAIELVSEFEEIEILNSL